MSDLSTLRTALANNLAGITGLRTSSIIPDQVTPPIAVVMPDGITYDQALARGGGDLYQFVVMLIVGRVDERSAQNRLDAYCSGTGASSVKAAIESDKTLGGEAFDCRVTNLRNYNQVTVGDTNYLSGEFVVQVYA